MTVSFSKKVIHPFLSIITVAHNAVTTIDKTIESVRSQKLELYEHIIIDGASTDGTIQVIESHEGTYPLRWVSEPDSGIANAMNKGIKLSKGRYILMLHADDRLWDSESLQKVFLHLYNEKHDIYAAPILMEYLNGMQILHKPNHFLCWYHFKTPFCHQGTIVHRRVFDHIGLFNESYAIAMDYDFFYRALKIHPSIIYQKLPLSVMGAYGVGTRQDIALKRIDEEYRVQTKNETNPIWRQIQFLFRMAYLPYKKLTLNLLSQIGADK